MAYSGWALLLLQESVLSCDPVVVRTLHERKFLVFSYLNDCFLIAVFWDSLVVVLTSVLTWIETQGWVAINLWSQLRGVQSMGGELDIVQDPTFPA